MKNIVASVLTAMASVVFAVGATDNTVTVKASAIKGQVFAGWYKDAERSVPYDKGGVDYRTEQMTYSMLETDTLFAMFASESDDKASIDFTFDPAVFYNSNESVSISLSSSVKSLSLPTLTVANLPTGLKYDAKTLSITGAPTKPGEMKEVKFTVKNVSNKTGSEFTRTFKIGDAQAASLPGLKYNKTPEEEGGYGLLVPGKAVDMESLLGISKEDLVGWTVTGLPAGMTFNTKTGAFSGAPTAADKSYLVTFKKGSETATISLATGALPVLAVGLEVFDAALTPVTDDEALLKQFKVTGAGSYAVGKAATLSATAAKGWVFAGWYDGLTMMPVDNGKQDYRTASSFSYTMPETATSETGVNLKARFVPAELDSDISIMAPSDILLPANADVEANGNFVFSVYSHSIPTVTAAGMPAGVTFDAKTLKFKGKPTAPGATATIKITAKNLTNKTGATREIKVKVGDATSTLLPELKYNDANGYPAFVPGKAPDMAAILGASTMNTLAEGGWTVTGLPAGMTFNSKTGTFSGAPTAADKSYLVTFKKGSEMATITLNTGALPALAVGLEVLDATLMPVTDEALLKLFKVTGAGSYAVGKAATLSATAAKGWVFAGWYDGLTMMPVDNGKQDYRTASSFSYTMPETATSETGANLRARFIPAELDSDISIMAPLNILLPANADVEDQLMFSVMSYSLPTVTAAGMPAGVTFDAKALKFNGKPTAPGATATIKITAKNLTNKTGVTWEIKVKVGDARSELLPGLLHDNENAYAPFVPGVVQDMAAVLGEGTMNTLAEGGWTVTGLPVGMTFNSRTGTFSGAPTAADKTYLVTFKNGSEMATITFKTGSMPELVLEPEIVDPNIMYPELGVAVPDVSQFKLTGAGNYAANKEVTLGATAPKGWVFAGWQDMSGLVFGPGMIPGLDANSNDTRVAAYKLKMPSADVTTLKGVFIHESQDALMSPSTSIEGQFVLTTGSEIGDEEINPMVSTCVRTMFLSSGSYGSFPTVTAKDLPAGMELDAKNLLLSGKITAPAGFYYSVFTAKNASGRTLSVPVRFIVNNEDGTPPSQGPEDVDTISAETKQGFGMDALTQMGSGIMPFKVGYPAFNEMDEEYLEYRMPDDVFDIGAYYSGTAYLFNGGVTAVATDAIPAGMKLMKEVDGNWTDYWVEGFPSAVGWVRFAVDAQNTDGSAGKFVKRLPVLDDTPMYVVLKVAQGDGTVTGGGVWNSGKTYDVKAAAANGYVFAGWYKDADCTMPAYNWTPGSECDYRVAAQKWTTASVVQFDTDKNTGLMPVTLYARFVPKGEDSSVSLSVNGAPADPSMSTFYFSDLSIMGMTIRLGAASQSLPDMTFTGLPTWMDKDAKLYAYGILLGYNGKSEPDPGEYSFTVAVKNQSGATVSQKFTIKVDNYMNLSLPLDYLMGYTLVPGESIEQSMSSLNSVPAELLKGWTVTGLPAGMTFDSKTGTFSGAPTAPDKSYTVWFKKAGEQTATVTMRTKPYPELVLVPEIVDPNMMYPELGVAIPAVSEFKLTGAGNYQANKEVTLGATAPKGWAFAGWRDAVTGMVPGDPAAASMVMDMFLDANSNDTRVAAYKFKMTSAEVTTLKGVFIHESQDMIGSMIAGIPAMPVLLALNTDVGDTMVNPSGSTCIRQMFQPASLLGSLPTVTVAASDLPPGVKFDAKNLLLSGKTTKAGFYYATFKGSNASGRTLAVPVEFIVAEGGNYQAEDPSNVDELTVDAGSFGLNQPYGVEFLMNLKTGMLRVGQPLSWDDPSRNWGYMIPSDSLGEPLGFSYSEGASLLSVSGLPTGLEVKKDTYSSSGNYSSTEWNVRGVPTAAGWYPLSVSGKNYEGSTARLAWRVAVLDDPSQYVVFKVAQGEGTVTGGGVWNSGKTYDVKATPATGYAFAGFYLDATCTMPAQNWTIGNWSDYRATAQKWTSASIVQYETIQDSSLPVFLFAKFVPTAEVAEVSAQTLGVVVDGYYDGGSSFVEGSLENGDLVWTLEPGAGSVEASLGLKFFADALPAITVAGLPAGLKFMGPFADGLAAIESEIGDEVRPEPGDYPVTLTIKSNGRTQQVSFIIRIGQYHSWEMDNAGLLPAYSLDTGATSDDWMKTLGIECDLAPGLEEQTWEGGSWKMSWKWSVTGLPKGLTFNATTGKITGSLAAVTEETTYIVHLKKTTTSTNKYGSQTYTDTYTDEATTAVTVLPLPSWVVGTFRGLCDVDGTDANEDDDPNWPEPDDKWEWPNEVEVTVSASGVVTMKIYDAEDLGSKSTVLATSNIYRLEGSETFCCDFWHDDGQEWGFGSFTIMEYPLTDGVGFGVLRGHEEGVDEDADLFVSDLLAYQDVYVAKPQGVTLPVFAATDRVADIYIDDLASTRLASGKLSGTLLLEFGANGAVTPSWDGDGAYVMAPAHHTPTGAFGDGTVQSSLWVMGYDSADDCAIGLELLLTIPCDNSGTASASGVSAFVNRVLIGY